MKADRPGQPGAPGRQHCRALDTEAHRARRLPPVCCPAPAGRYPRNAPAMTAPSAGWAVLLAQDMDLPPKAHRQGRSRRSRRRAMAQAPALSLIFRGKTRRLSGERGQSEDLPNLRYETPL